VRILFTGDDATPRGRAEGPPAPGFIPDHGPSVWTHSETPRHAPRFRNAHFEGEPQDVQTVR